MYMEELDENSQICNKNYLVAYLDILGFKSHVENFVNNNSDNHKEILTKIKLALKIALDSPFLNAHKDYNINIQYRQFSDCTCFSISDFSGNPVEESYILYAFIHFLNGFNYILLLFDLYIRGGISIGFHYEDDNIIFSEGLIKAYELESKSIYPRIILDDELIKRLKTSWISMDDELSIMGMDKVIISDWDGSIFINPFNHFQSLEKMIKNNLTKTSLYEETNGLTINSVKSDYEFHIRVLKNLENKISEIKLDDKMDNHVLRKFIWLKELLKWNMDPESSKIKFEYLLKSK